MSETNNKPIQNESAAAISAAPSSANSGKESGSKASRQGRGKLSVFFGVLFNLILLAGIGYLGFMVYEQDKAIAALFEQQNSFSSQRDDAGEQLGQMQNLIGNLEQELAAAQQEAAALMQAQTEEMAKQAAELAAQQSAAIESLQSELVSTRLRITNNNPGASQEWLLAEAASLLRLAQQQLITTRSVRTAQALFIAADDVLKQINDPAVFSVREILAGELAAIRAVPEVDIQDIYLQLGALSGQLGALGVSNDLSQQLAQGERVSFGNDSQSEDAGVMSGLLSSFKNSLDSYLVVRRRDEAVRPLMTPGQEAALVQSVRLQIEQGRTALLKGEQEIFTSSLTQARATIAEYMAGEAALKSSILETLDTLAGRRIVTETPSLMRTSAALEQILSAGESQFGEPVIAQ